MNITLKEAVFYVVASAGVNQCQKQLEENEIKQHINYEENIKVIKQQLTADKFDSLKTCINENDNSIVKSLSWKDIADSVRKRIDFETIAKSVCK